MASFAERALKSEEYQANELPEILLTQRYNFGWVYRDRFVRKGNFNENDH